MPFNELNQQVPDSVAQEARNRGCLNGVRYVYQEGQYGPRQRPCASLGCFRATRFGSTNYQNFRVSLGDGWVAFRSPSGTAQAQQPVVGEPVVEEPVVDEPTVVEPTVDEAVVCDAAERRFLPGALDQVLDLLSSERYMPDDDPWLAQGRKHVEQSIDSLIQEFAQFPYLHRVEHSIHAQLFHIMMSHEELAQRVLFGNDSATTQLVHKEWPESIAREDKDRGNFDLAVLTPQLLKSCASIKAFREGRLHAPIVIEVGLDYKAKHLAGDVLKLLNSKPKYGYLIHLVRESSREPEAEKIILESESKFGIKTAYVWTSLGEVVVKGVNEQQITPR
jgi:hypothetical protein